MQTHSPWTSLRLPIVIFLSGMSGLIYQTVWMRMLIRVFGITVQATSVVVAVFMGGLALGAWAMGRFTARRNLSLRTYAAVEGAIAASAVLSTFVLAKLPGLYASLTASWELKPQTAATPEETVLRLALSAAVLIVPTFLMGCTFPLLTHVTAGDAAAFGKRVGLLYGLNTFGAVAGVFAAGFVTIALWGEKASVGIAAALNAGIALFLVYGFPRAAPAATPAETDAPVGRSASFYYAVAAATGFCALSFEVLWTRLLTLLMGSSVYAFASMLMLYLLGVAGGSLLAARRLDGLRAPVTALAALLGGTALAGAVSLRLYEGVGLLMSDAKYLYSPLQRAADIPPLFFAGAVVVLPVTLGLGAIFPLLCRLVTTRPAEGGRAVGTLYAANTAGGVAGALVTGFFLTGALGTNRAFAVLLLLLLLLAGLVYRRAETRVPRGGPAYFTAVAGAALILLPWGSDPFLHIVTRRFERLFPDGKILFHRDEPAAALTGYQSPQAGAVLLINGIVVSGKGLAGSLMAYVPAVLQEAPKRALVICFGVGNTFRAFADTVGAVDAVELVPGVPRAFPSFAPDAADYMARPNVRVFYQDGRHYLLRSPDAYDIIVVDASPPIFSAGTVNLYTAEFLTLARARLTDKGIFALWVPLHCFESDFWRIARNFADVFPSVRLWAWPNLPGFLLMGSPSPIPSPDVVAVADKMKARGIDAPWLTAEALHAGFVLTEEQLRAHAGRYPPVTDDRPATEFPLGRFLAGDTFHDNPRFILRARRN